jgi:hypothetical protein
VTFAEASELIASFWKGASPLGPGDARAVGRLDREFFRPLPKEVAAYVSAYAPVSERSFETVGNPPTLYPADGLKARADGYNWNPLAKAVIDGWSDSWLLVADEGADPVLLKELLAEAGAVVAPS